MPYYPPQVTASLSATYPAGETINGHRAVYLVGGEVFHADKDVAFNAVLGLSLNAAAIGDNVVVRFAGIAEEPSWTWTEGEPIFLGDDGVLTQTPPGIGSLIELGVALTATSVDVRVQEPVVLS